MCISQVQKLRCVLLLVQGERYHTSHKMCVALGLVGKVSTQAMKYVLLLVQR